MNDLKKAADAYEREHGSCLNSRTTPGTPVGECEYTQCGCDLGKAFLAGAAWQREQDAKLVARLIPHHDVCGPALQEAATHIRKQAFDGTSQDG